MINVSSAFKKAIKDGNRKYIVEANITLADGTVLEIRNKNIWSNGFSFSEATSRNSNEFSIGATVIGNMTLILDNITDIYSGYDFYDAVIEVKIGLELDDGTIEMFRKGYYTVEKPTYNGSLITLNCIDNMWRFEKPFADVQVEAPTTIGYIVASICNHCDVELSNGEFPRYFFEIPEFPDKEMNCREMLGYLAQICCCYAKIDNNGRLVFDWYIKENQHKEDRLDGGIFDHYKPYQTGDTADGGNFLDYSSGDNYDGGIFGDGNERYTITSLKSMNVNTDDFIFTGVKVLISGAKEDEEKEVFVGDDKYVVKIENNPLIIGKEIAESVANYLASKLIGFSFRKFSVSALNAVYVEAGDPCILDDYRGHRYASYITDLSFTVGNVETFICGGEEINRNNVVHYSSEIQTITEARRYTEAQISQYDKAVQNMTKLAVNAMGYFQTVEKQEDGSTVTYLHNRPLLSESRTIYKMTIDGFFISQDGGDTYTAGFDADGNVLVNVLSAIGIKFDWAQGGQLSLGGYGNERGILSVFGSDNATEVARLTNDNFYIRSEDYTPSTFSNSHHLKNSSLNDKVFGEYIVFPEDILSGFIRVYFDNISTGILKIKFRKHLDASADEIEYSIEYANAEYVDIFGNDLYRLLNGIVVLTEIETNDFVGIYKICSISRYGLIKRVKNFPTLDNGTGSSANLFSDEMTLGKCSINNNGFFYNNQRLGSTVLLGCEALYQSASSSTIETKEFELEIDIGVFNSLSEIVICIQDTAYAPNFATPLRIWSFPTALFTFSEYVAHGFNDVSIKNCTIQLKNDGKMRFIIITSPAQNVTFYENIYILGKI